MLNKLTHSLKHFVYLVEMHTLHYNYCNFLINKLLHVSRLTGPSSGSVQLYEQLSVPIFSSDKWNCRKFISVVFVYMDMCTVIGAACMFEC